MGNVRPLIDYLSTSTSSAVQAFGLVRLNTSSNLQRNLSKMFAKPCRKNASVHLIQHLVEQNAPVDPGATSPASERPALFMRCFLLPVICLASPPRVACARSAAFQPSQPDPFEPGVTTKRPDNGTGAAARQLVVLPGKREVDRERFTRLKCVQPTAKKQPLRMPRLISQTPPYHHSSDLLLLRTGTD